MKLSKEELKKKIDEVIEDEDLKISLLEDIEDSVEVAAQDTESKEEIERLKTELEELKQKYKERFLKVEEVIEKIGESDDDIEVEEVVDIKEI